MSPEQGCRAVPEQHFQVENSVSVKNTGARFTLKISDNQNLEPMLPKKKNGGKILMAS